MANQPESASYDVGIYQLEIVDSVDGGVGAKSNAPLLSLANRTAYLKAHLDALEAGTFVPNGFALLNSPIFTGLPTGPTQAAGDNTTKLATTAFVQTTVNGTVSVDISGAATTTLTQPQYGPAILKLTGAVTANKAVVFPNISCHWQVINNSTGAFTVTLKTAAGSGIVLSAGMSSNIYCDGTNVTLQQTDFISPALTGVPTAPTAAAGTNSSQIATAAFVQAAIASLAAATQPALGYTPVQQGTGFGQIGSNVVKIGWSAVSKVKVTVDTTDLGNVALENWVGAGYAPLVSPALSGTPTAPTAAPGTNSTQLATAAFVQAAITSLTTTMNTALSGKQASLGYTPVQQGTGVGQTGNTIKIGWDGASKVKVTVDVGDLGNIALENWVGAGYAPLVSPALSGTPTAPTAAPGTNSTQLATAAFVQAAITSLTTTMNTALSGKQASLGYTPVQQGTGVGQSPNVVKIGWSAVSKVKVTVDTTDMGNIALENWVGAGYATLASFQRSMGANGWQMLSGGTIIQWGANTTDANGNCTVNFPMAFPNAVLGMTVCGRWNAALYALNAGNSWRNAGQAAVFMNYNGAAMSAGFDWIAIGY